MNAKIFKELCSKNEHDILVSSILLLNTKKFTTMRSFVERYGFLVSILLWMLKILQINVQIMNVEGENKNIIKLHNI